MPMAALCGSRQCRMPGPFVTHCIPHASKSQHYAWGERDLSRCPALDAVMLLHMMARLQQHSLCAALGIPILALCICSTGGTESDTLPTWRAPVVIPMKFGKGLKNVNTPNQGAAEPTNFGRQANKKAHDKPRGGLFACFGPSSATA